MYSYVYISPTTFHSFNCGHTVKGKELVCCLQKVHTNLPRNRVD